MMNRKDQVTLLLQRVRGGDGNAASELMPLVYSELKLLAQAVFSDRRAHTLQPTALVHEVWMKLAGHLENVSDRKHFFVVAGGAMRQVLTDHARKHGALKRAAAGSRITLAHDLANKENSGVELIALEDTLRRLSELNEMHARIVELRIFSGLTIDETAEVLGVSPRKVDKDWFMAKTWLRKELKSEG